MQQAIHKHFGFLKTTAVGGLIFLLPLVVIGALIGQVVPIVLTVAEVLGEWIPVRTVGGISALVAVAIGIVVLACFLAGLAARLSLGKRFSQFIEQNLMMLFPRYGIIRDQMTGSIGGDLDMPKLRPVMVSIQDVYRLAFEVEESTPGLATVYLPGAPDPWAGCVVYLPSDRISRLDIPFNDAVAICEQLGRNSASILQGISPQG